MNGSVIRLDGVPHACIFKLLPEGFFYFLFFFYQISQFVHNFNYELQGLHFIDTLTKKQNQFCLLLFSSIFLRKPSIKVWVINTDHSTIENIFIAILFCRLTLECSPWKKNCMNALHCSPRNTDESHPHCTHNVTQHSPFLSTHRKTVLEVFCFFFCFFSP